MEEDSPERGLFEVYILSETLGKILQHCKSQVPYEAIGFLVGKDYSWLGKMYVQIDGAIFGKTLASQVRVEFDEGVMGEIVTELRQKYSGKKVVGWYHSHPGYGCFMSSTDIETQKACFREPYHIALVVDPIQELVDFFKLQEDGQTYRQASFREFKPARQEDTQGARSAHTLRCQYCNAHLSPVAMFCSMCGQRIKA